MVEIQSEQSGAQQRIPCPHCQESISINAKKCFHCGELVGSRKSLRFITTRLVGYVGVFTALLSGFYALREGYFYVQKQQQARAEIRSFQAVSEHFEQVGSLDYAEFALQKALDVEPNNQNIKLNLFLLRCRRLFEEIEWQTLLNEQQISLVKELILEGHRLQQDPLGDEMNARVSLALGRLIPQDGAWNDDNAVTQQFDLTIKLKPDEAEGLFRYGTWLVASEYDPEKGLELMHRATKLSEKDALYHYELGKVLSRREQFQRALPYLQSAVSLRPFQQNLVRIQASNFAKVELRRMFSAMTTKFDITQEQFGGLSMDQRQQVLEQILSFGKGYKDVNKQGVDFYLHIGNLDKALELVTLLVSDEELGKPVRGYTLDDKERYLAVLEARGEQPQLRETLARDIRAFRLSQNWEEFLHWGIVGRHRYKVGLRVEKGLVQGGLKVLKVFSGYPFAKAGVQEGDVLKEVGHQGVKELNHVMIVLDRFKAGDAMPLLVSRDGKDLALSLIVE